MNVIDMIQAAIAKRRLEGPIPDNTYPLVRIGSATYWIVTYQQGVVELTQVVYNHNTKSWQWPNEPSNNFMKADLITAAQLLWVTVK